MTTVAVLFVLSGAALWACARWRPEHLPAFLCFLLCLAPLEVRFPLPGALPNLTLQRFLLLLALALYPGLPKAGSGVVDGTRLPYAGLILANVAVLFISTVFSVNRVDSVKELASAVLELYLLYFLLVRMVGDFTSLENVSRAIVLAVAVGCVLGLLRQCFGFEYRTYLPAVQHRFMDMVDAARGDRLRSVYPHAILFGGMIAVALPFLLLWVARAPTASLRVALCGLLAVFAFCMYRTLSRGPWLALALMLAFVFVYSGRDIRAQILGAAFLGLVVLCLRPGIFGTLSDLFRHTFVPDSLVGASFSYREALLRLAVDTLKESPLRALFGFGPGTFFGLQLETEFRGRTHGFYSCDSSWVGFMFTSGYVGLLSMAALLCKPAWDCFRHLRGQMDDDRNFLAAVAAGLGGYYFMMTNVAIYGWGQPAFVPWILIAMFVIHKRLVDRPPEESTETALACATDVAPYE
jgi:hypothetical protein